jgi:hypothetical protein
MTFNEVNQALRSGADSVAKIRCLTETGDSVAFDKAVATALSTRDARIDELLASLENGGDSGAQTDSDARAVAGRGRKRWCRLVP